MVRHDYVEGNWRIQRERKIETVEMMERHSVILFPRSQNKPQAAWSVYQNLKANAKIELQEIWCYYVVQNCIDRENNYELYKVTGYT
jgi:hypothetical protein